MTVVPKLLVMICGLSICAAAAGAQPPGRGQRQGLQPPGVEPGVSPVEIQKMFDAYALMQAQEQLKIGDDQFNQFLTRFKALQEMRRKGLQERGRLIMQMRRLLNAGQSDEAQLRDRVKEMDEAETRSAADVKKAYDAIDQMLDVRQQARFRVFEEMMERRKQELVNRARQNNRPPLPKF